MLGIEEEALYGCEKLMKISSAGGSRLEEVRSNAFGQTGLEPEQVRFPPNIRLAEDAFSKQ